MEKELKEEILSAYKKYHLIRVAIAAPFFALGTYGFFQGLQDLVYNYGEVSIPGAIIFTALFVGTGAYIWHFMLAFRPGQVKVALSSGLEKMSFVGLGKQRLWGWRIEFGTYGAETFRIFGKQETIWRFGAGIGLAAVNAQLKFPEEFIQSLSEQDQELVRARLVDRPEVGY